MNKKYLLLALPAFLVLSGCGSHAFNKEEVIQPKVTMSEDTLAHEEIFGGEEDTVEFRPTIASPLNATLPEVSAKIGYQLQYNDNGSDPDTISIRFVAALPESLSGATAVWHRGLARPNGFEGYNIGTEQEQVWKYKFSGENNPKDLTSNKRYLALNNGGERVEAGKGDFVGYSCFAIYTLMGIPYEELKDSYLGAYVSLGSDNSQGIAVKIERNGTASKNRFYFDPSVSGHFLEGTINGALRNGSNSGENSLLRATETEGNAKATYNSVSFSASDSFGSFYFGSKADGQHFQFFGHSAFFDTSADYFDADALGEFNSPKAAGTHTLYVYSAGTGAENHVHVKKEVTLYFVVPWSGWEAISAYSFLNSGGGSSEKAAWPGERMSYVGVNDDNNTLFSYTVDLGLYDRINYNNGGGWETGSVDISGVSNADYFEVKNDNGFKVEHKGTYTDSLLTSRQVIYFSNNKNWSNVHFHVFNSSSQASEATWPGNDAKWVANNYLGEGIYRLVINPAYDSFIFNGSGGQTVDIRLSDLQEGKNAYYLSDSTDWQGHFNVAQYSFDPLNPLAH